MAYEIPVNLHTVFKWCRIFLVHFFSSGIDYILTDGQHKPEHQSSGSGEGQDLVKYLEAEIRILVAL